MVECECPGGDGYPSRGGGRFSVPAAQEIVINIFR